MKTTLLTLFLCLGLLPSLAVDLDGNHLDDVWEMLYFGQTGNDPAADPDTDGVANLAECRAATDPFDSQSLFEVLDLTDLKSQRIEWTTRPGKVYHIEFADDLEGPWTNQFDVPLPAGGRGPVSIPGNGEQMCLDVSDPARPLIKGGATRELWVGTGPSSSVNDFKTTYLGWATTSTPNDGTPAILPTGSGATQGLQAPSNERDQYGQRLCGYIHAPESGDYTFYIAGRHQCEFWLNPVSDDPDPAGMELVLRQTSTAMTNPTNWTWHVDNGIADQQKSAPVTLQAGGLYYFEALHRHYGQEDHLAVGWTKPSDPVSQIEVIPGEWVCPRLDLSGHNAADLFSSDMRHFRITTFASDDPDAPDDDGDGIDNATEHLLADWDPYSDFSAVTDLNDLAALSNAISAAGEQISVFTMDDTATEDTAFTNAGIPRNRDPARFLLVRRGSLRPLTVFYSLGGGDDLVDGLAEEEENPEPTDYREEDIHGSPLFGSVTFPGGATRMQVVIDPVADAIFEYPETISLQLDPHADYSLDVAAERAEAKIYDVRNDSENEILFVGFSLPQPGSMQPKGSAICTGKLNARRDTLTLFTSITAGFSAPQNNSHIHKDMGSPGSDPVTFSLPTQGEIANLEWPLCINGAFRPQKMMDSLFNQLGETTATGESKVYINWHTANNPAGELYAYLCPAIGSVTPPDPDPPPGIAFIDPVSEEKALKAEISRFLNQATFGATTSNVASIYSDILAHPAQDRMAVFSDWIDAQLDPSVTDQTRVLDYAYASDWQSWVYRGYFDASYYEPGDWGSNGAPETRTPPEDPIGPVPLPGAWASVTPHNPETLDYTQAAGFPGPTAAFPMSQATIDMVRRGEDLGFGEEQNRSARHALWTVMLNGQDQLRQRMAYTWSQILVISDADGEISRNYYGRARYWDMLAENSDDTFREMLEGVTYSPMMGQYLTHLKNAREADLDGDGEADVYPDENYAREIMQLFTIGLFKLHLDGTLALDAATGLPQATYNNEQIAELARVMTGFSYSRYAFEPTQWTAPLENTNFSRGSGNRFYGARYDYPMKMFGDQHDVGVKNLPDGIILNNTNLPTAEAIAHADLSQVHDWLAGSGAAPHDGHQSTPAFLARRLIQRLVTSNPPRDYIHRVATVFEETGGDLKAVTRAVLLDYHARSPEIIDASYGRKKPPLMAYLQLARALEFGSLLPIDELGNDLGNVSDYGMPAAQRDNYERNMRFRFGNTNEQLSMSPLGAPSVFNFFLPDYSPGGEISGASLVAPEFQILNEITAIQNLNFFYGAIYFSGGQSIETLPNQDDWGYTNNADHAAFDFRSLAASYDSTSALSEWERDKLLVDALDELLNGGDLQNTYSLDPVDRTPAAGDLMVVDADRNPYETIIDALTESFSVTSVNGSRDKVRLACFLISASPSFQVQR